MENSKTKFRPILFSTPMVQALLEKRKTMTRRTKGLEEVNKNPDDWKFEAFGKNPDNEKDKRLCAYFTIKGTETWFYQICPYQVGDVFWVRENFYTASNWDHWKPSMLKSVNVEVFYEADRNDDTISKPLHRGKSRPCIFLPFEYSRIFLKIKSIRVERLQDISKEDIKNEGVQLTVDRNGHVLFELGEKHNPFSFAKKTSIMSNHEVWLTHWAALWCKINGFESWKQNPFVFVYEFEQIEKPLNFIV